MSIMSPQNVVTLVLILIVIYSEQISRLEVFRQDRVLTAGLFLFVELCIGIAFLAVHY